MPLPDAIAAADQYRRALDARERAALTRLVRAYAGVARRLQTQVDALGADLDAALADGVELSAAKLGRYDRLRELQKQVAAEVTRYGAVAEAEMDALTQGAVRQGAADAKALTQLSLPGVAQISGAVMQQWQALPADAIETLLGFLGPDSPMRDALVTKLGPAVADQVGSALVETLALGVGPRKAAAVVQNIVREQLGKGLTWSLTTTRTAHLWAYREASRAAYAANPKIVKGWRWVSARDERTCGSCLAKDGSVHPVTESLDDHHNGRCRMVPITPTYRDLGFDVDEAPPVLEHETGEAWFRAQTPAVQRSILGPGKLDALNAGQFKFADLSTPYSDPVYGQMAREATLKELLAGKSAAVMAPSWQRAISGVDVDYGDATQLQAELLHSAVETVGPLPERIKDVRFVHSKGMAIADDTINTTVAEYDDLKQVLRVNVDAPYWQDPVKQAKRNKLIGEFSSDRPDHPIIHEIGHAAHSSASPTRYRAAGNYSFRTDREFNMVFDDVSKYATENGAEFVAEVYAAHKAGQRFSQPIMEIYSRLNGPLLGD